jgi:hypothetical protein
LYLFKVSGVKYAPQPGLELLDCSKFLESMMNVHTLDFHIMMAIL